VKDVQTIFGRKITFLIMTQIPMTCLPIIFPPVLLSATGVYSRCRFIGFWENDEIINWSDGFHQGQFFADSLWDAFTNHLSVAVFLYPYQLGSVHALMLDTATNQVYVGEILQVQEFLRSQPYVESEADAPDNEPIINPLEIIITTGRQELANQQNLIHSLNSQITQELIEHYYRAVDNGDVRGLVALQQLLSILPNISSNQQEAS
jgi:hypothetical protein